MSTLSEPILAAIQDVKRAKLALKHARERLEAELPQDWADDIHYNGDRCSVPVEVYKAMREP
jgi:hypothetical protein